MVCDANTMSEGDIKIRFNKLCQQFQNNKKYISASLSESDYTIPEKEDISYELLVHKKRYEAVFYQQPANLDTTAIAKEMQDFLLTKYTEEQLANPAEDEQKDMMMAVTSYMLDKISKKVVWFMISEYYGKYYITILYDNEYNRANGRRRKRYPRTDFCESRPPLLPDFVARHPVYRGFERLCGYPHHRKENYYQINAESACRAPSG
jgi:hypothetical protein